MNNTWVLIIVIPTVIYLWVKAQLWMDKLCALLRSLQPPRRVHWPVSVSLNSITIKGIIMQLRIHAGKEVPVVLGKPVKKDGTPAEIEEGSLKIEVVDGGNAHADHIVSWERDPLAANPDDPYTGKLVWHEAGDAILRVTGDADLGEGVETIELDIEIEALAEEAVGFSDPTVGEERDHVEESEQA